MVVLSQGWVWAWKALVLTPALVESYLEGGRGLSFGRGDSKMVAGLGVFLQLEQCQEMSGFERVLKMWEGILAHFWWVHFWQVSHMTEAWFDLQGFLQSEHGYL